MPLLRHYWLRHYCHDITWYYAITFYYITLLTLTLHATLRHITLLTLRHYDITLFDDTWYWCHYWWWYITPLTPLLRHYAIDDIITHIDITLMPLLIHYAISWHYWLPLRHYWCHYAITPWYLIIDTLLHITPCHIYYAITCHYATCHYDIIDDAITPLLLHDY
jgi:hypothetical protein